MIWPDYTSNARFDEGPLAGVVDGSPSQSLNVVGQCPQGQPGTPERSLCSKGVRAMPARSRPQQARADNVPSRPK
jgi:hypothetical protein